MKIQQFKPDFSQSFQVRNSELQKSRVATLKHSTNKLDAEDKLSCNNLIKKTNRLMLDDCILETEPAETRVETRISPLFASTRRHSSRGCVAFTFASVASTLESPKSTKSFSNVITLPRGDDDESIDEENSSSLLETPTDIMNHRISEIHKKTLPALDQADLD